MKFKIKHINKIPIHFYKTALHMAVEKENIEIIELLLSNPNIDINIKDKI